MATSVRPPRSPATVAAPPAKQPAGQSPIGFTTEDTRRATAERDKDRTRLPELATNLTDEVRWPKRGVQSRVAHRIWN